MGVAVFLKNKDALGLREARNIIMREALGRNSKESIQKFEKQYKQTDEDYNNDIKLLLSSFSFQLEKLESFRPWLEELKKPESIQKYMPFIVARMFDQERLAHSIFEMIYKELGKDHLLFSQKTFDTHPELKKALLHTDLDAHSMAVANAEHWLNSAEGKQVLCDGVVYKDSIEFLLGESCPSSSSHELQ